MLRVDVDRIVSHKMTGVCTREHVVWEDPDPFCVRNCQVVSWSSYMMNVWICVCPPQETEFELLGRVELHNLLGP